MWAKRRLDDEFSVSKMSCSTSLILGERGREDWRGMAETWKLPMWKELRSITPLFWGSMSVFLVFIPIDLCQFLHDDMTNCPDRHDPVGRWGRFGEICRLISSRKVVSLDLSNLSDGLGLKISIILMTMSYGTQRVHWVMEENRFSILNIDLTKTSQTTKWPLDDVSCRRVHFFQQSWLFRR